MRFILASCIAIVRINASVIPNNGSNTEYIGDDTTPEADHISYGPPAVSPPTGDSPAPPCAPTDRINTRSITEYIYCGDSSNLPNVSEGIEIISKTTMETESEHIRESVEQSLRGGIVGDDDNEILDTADEYLIIHADPWIFYPTPSDELVYPQITL